MFARVALAEGEKLKSNILSQDFALLGSGSPISFRATAMSA
jgi:hypothetical protein